MLLEEIELKYVMNIPFPAAASIYFQDSGFEPIFRARVIVRDQSQAEMFHTHSKVRKPFNFDPPESTEIFLSRKNKFNESFFVNITKKHTFILRI